MPSELPAPPRPRLIDLSYWLWFGACVVGVITAIATLRYFGELKALVLLTLEREHPLETLATRERVAMATVATLIGAGALIALVQTTLAFTMRSGRGWARFPLVGLTLLSALYSVKVFGEAPPITQAGLLASTALMVIASVPTCLPGTRTWFAHRRMARSIGADNRQ
ncbi:MAG: hypothetical protein ACRDRA_01460 [Pseudonocardiaceae bacterium]